jgi:fumarate reductase subunit D
MAQFARATIRFVLAHRTTMRLACTTICDRIRLAFFAIRVHEWASRLRWKDRGFVTSLAHGLVFFVLANVTNVFSARFAIRVVEIRARIAFGVLECTRGRTCGLACGASVPLGIIQVPADDATLSASAFPMRVWNAYFLLVVITIITSARGVSHGMTDFAFVRGCTVHAPFGLIGVLNVLFGRRVLVVIDDRILARLVVGIVVVKDGFA